MATITATIGHWHKEKNIYFVYVEDPVDRFHSGPDADALALEIKRELESMEQAVAGYPESTDSVPDVEKIMRQIRAESESDGERSDE